MQMETATCFPGKRNFSNMSGFVLTMHVGLQESHEKSSQITIVPRP